jgi:hypothetical protein
MRCSGIAASAAVAGRTGALSHFDDHGNKLSPSTGGVNDISTIMEMMPRPTSSQRAARLSFSVETVLPYSPVAAPFTGELVDAP